VSLTVSNGCGEDTETKTGYITAEDCAPIPPAAAGGGCPTTKYLTVDWEGNNTTKPLYSNNCLAVDLLGPSPDISDSLFLERGTHAPIVDERTYYLIVVRELEEIPPVPENYEAIVVLNITPTDAEFNKDLFLTLGLNQTQLPQNVLNLTMAYYDDVNGLWERLDYEAGGPNGVAELTLSAPINHFSIYGVLAELAPTPTQPAHFVPSSLSITPSVEKIWKSITFVTKTG
jgi:PKD repeat protein